MTLSPAADLATSTWPPIISGATDDQPSRSDYRRFAPAGKDAGASGRQDAEASGVAGWRRLPPPLVALDPMSPAGVFRELSVSGALASSLRKIEG